MRVEFFFKAQSELSALVNFMGAYQQSTAVNPSSLASKVSTSAVPTIFNRFNLANKLKNDNLLASAKNIINIMPAANVCVHYSLKYNTQKSVEQSFSYFNGFLSKAEQMGVAEILVISGSGDKKALNTVSCLQMLRESENHATNVNIAVAFNPYFPDDKNRSVEVDRLSAKLATGMVSTIYLQFGSDTSLLKEGLIAINKALESYGASDDKLKRANFKEVKVIGSVMIPSKQLLARMKFRPWNGVYLSETFLGGVPAAEGIVLEMLDIYRDFGVEPLVETAFKNDSEASHILSLLSGANYFENMVESDDCVPDEVLTSTPSLLPDQAHAVPKRRKRIMNP
jgi:hypothetical protein